MLWSLLKIVLFIGLVIGAAWGGGMLLESDGGIQISVAGTEYTLGPLATVVALLALVVAVWIALKVVSLFVAFLRFASGDKTAIDRFFDRRRERKGFDALAESLTALASGESKQALAKAARAEKLLRRPDLTTLLTAQAAEQSGDRVQAEAAYKRLLKDERTRFVGVRGLMKQQLDAGNTDTALKLAEKAFGLKPKHEETQNRLLELQAGSHDWAGARRTLAAKVKHGSLPRDVHKRRDAVLALGEARDTIGEDTPAAREAAINANRQSPDLIPAAVFAADAFVAQNKPKNATRILRKAWGAAPHPDLAAAFARIVPDETPDARIKRFAALTNQHRDHPETRMLEAELKITAEDFPGARDALGDLAESDPTARSLAIMAAIERGLGADDAVVKGWLARALTAPRGPQWVCDNCNKTHAGWEPICDACNGLDTLSWRTPADESSPLPAGAEMLPLIVGQVEVQEVEEEEDPTPEPDPGSSDTEESNSADDAENSVDPDLAEEEEGSDDHGKSAAAPDDVKIANADSPPLDYAVEKEAK